MIALVILTLVVFFVILVFTVSWAIRQIVVECDVITGFLVLVMDFLGFVVFLAFLQRIISAYL